MTNKEAIFELIKCRRRLEEDPTIIFGCGAFDAEPFDMAIEALERKQGKWLLGGRCSECLVAPLTSHKNYCPNCGADMRERSKDECNI